MDRITTKRPGGTAPAFGRMLAAVLALVFALVSTARADDRCAQPEPVCAARDAVFVISSFDPFASAVRIGPDRLVANRHSVADAKTVRLTGKDGGTVEARVVPTSYEGDLVLLDAEGLGEGPVLGRREGAIEGELYTLGGDIARRAVRAYPPGRLLLPRAPEAPYGRLHHTAYSQPGNSGGALVDGEGALVGIIASGGEGRFEAVPASEITRLEDMSGPGHAARHREIGRAYRACIEGIENAPAPPGRLDDETARKLAAACTASGNRQLLDLAAQTLAKGRRLEQAIALSERAVARDPHAVNSRLTLVTALHIAGRFEDEIPHLGMLLKVLPGDPGVQRFAIQAGKWTGHMGLARHALELLKQHNPAQAEAAERFLKADLPPPQPRKP